MGQRASSQVRGWGGEGGSGARRERGEGGGYTPEWVLDPIDLGDNDLSHRGMRGGAQGQVLGGELAGKGGGEG